MRSAFASPLHHFLAAFYYQIWYGTGPMVTVQNRNDVNRPNIECIVRSQWTKFGVMTNLVGSPFLIRPSIGGRRTNGWHEIDGGTKKYGHLGKVVENLVKISTKYKDMFS